MPRTSLQVINAFRQAGCFRPGVASNSGSTQIAQRKFHNTALSKASVFTSSNGTTSTIHIKKTAGACGAEISGVDLAKDMTDPGVVKEIRNALLEHGVIFFRKQGHLTSEDYLAFTQKFGTPVKYPFISGIEGHPEIIQVLKREQEKTNFGGIWHADTTYLDEPPMGSVLLARELPPYGGDTCFANQHVAYNALSDGLKKTLSGLRAISSSAKADVTKTREDRVKEEGAAEAKTFEVSHPVIRTHPETGRKVLYVNVAHTLRFDGWTEEESTPLLNYLFQHQAKLEHTCRFTWEDGSLAFWDNRTVHHNPVNDYHGYKRLLHRITLAGDVPK